MNRDPVVVVGTGRCGTSTVARILQERLGVLMWKEECIRTDSWNSKGYFEDKRCKLYVKGLIASAELPDADRDAASEHAARQIREWMGSGGISWGFKLPQTALCPPELLRHLRPRRIIVCVRERHQTASSIHRWRRESWKMDINGALDKHDARLASLNCLLHGYAALWLDFSEARDEDVLTQTIRNFLLLDHEAHVSGMELKHERNS